MSTHNSKTFINNLLILLGLVGLLSALLGTGKGAPYKNSVSKSAKVKIYKGE